MLKRANFLKRAPKCPSRAVSLPAHPKSVLLPSQPQPKASTLHRDDLPRFAYICTLDRKVWITFSNDLKLCAIFDLHAVHERIRYEYYLASFKAAHDLGDLSHIDSAVVEKAGKAIPPIFGPTINTIVKVEKRLDEIFETNRSAAEVFGISLQRNNQGQICITGYQPIFGHKFTPSELNNILIDHLTRPSRVPIVIDQWIGEFACKNAYKFNHELPPELPQKLINNLAKCVFPWHCVHGRTTVHVKNLKLPHA